MEGATLIEVLVGLVIFSSVLLAMLAVLIQGIRMMRDNLYHLQALETISAIHENLLMQQNLTPLSQDKVMDVTPWVEDIAHHLPNGKVELTFNKEEAKIEISWQGLTKPHTLSSAIPLLFSNLLVLDDEKSPNERL